MEFFNSGGDKTTNIEYCSAKEQEQEQEQKSLLGGYGH